jgi:hypothetical protein
VQNELGAGSSNVLVLLGEKVLFNCLAEWAKENRYKLLVYKEDIQSSIKNFHVESPII